MRSLSLRFLAVVSLLFVPFAAQAANVTVNGTVSFASLDGSVDDADHVSNGVFTVNGDLTVNGTINCNDDGPGANSACAMQFAVSGNLVLGSGSVGERADSGQGEIPALGDADGEHLDTPSTFEHS